MIQVNDKYNQIILNFLQDEISVEEQKELDLWLAESSENFAYFNSVKKIWDYTPISTDKEYDVEAALEKVHKRIEALENKKVTEPKRNWLSRYYIHISTVAAVILIGLILTLFVDRKNSLTTLTAEAEQTFILPDSTHIKMSPNAIVSYSDNFDNNSREINFEGCAYFDVTSNPDKPFKIQVGNMVVEVLGTTFDIKAEKGSEKYFVDLYSGKVKMYSIDNKGNQIEQIVLLPGEQGVYDNGSQRIERLCQSSSNNIFSIKTGILDFNNVSLLTVTQSLSEAYNINIYLDAKYENLKLTARFENESLESIFETIAAIFDLEIVRIGNTVTIR